MKKAILCLLALSLAAGAFAKASMEDGNYVGVNMTFPLAWEWAQREGIQTNTFTNSLGVSIDSLTMFTPLLGGYVALDFFWPQKLSSTIGGGYTVSVRRDAYELLFGLDALFAVAIAPVYTDRLLVSISPGIHYMMLAANGKYAGTVSYLFGLGAAIDVRYNFTDTFYVRGGVDIGYDFFGITLASTAFSSTFESGLANNLLLEPKIGLGFRY